VSSNEQLWAQTFERSILVENYYEFQDTIVNQTLASLMGLNGIISCYQTDKIDCEHPMPGRLYHIEYWFHKHVKNFNMATAREAKEFYKKVTDTDSRNALAYAYLSQINSAEALISMDDFEKSLDDGLLFVHQSIRCDQHCQEGYLALATNLLFRSNYGAAVQVIERGEAINPKSNDYRGSMGALLIYMGFYDRGKKNLDSAFAQSPNLTWWHILAFSYYSFDREHYQDAIYWTDRIEMNVEQIPIIKAASYGYLGEFEKAFEALDELEFDDPLKDIIPIELLSKRFALRDMAMKVQLGLQRLVQFKSVETLA
jgi:tetratricopeptide (TPR) repeat protein